MLMDLLLPQLAAPVSDCSSQLFSHLVTVPSGVRDRRWTHSYFTTPSAALVGSFQPLPGNATPWPISSFSDRGVATPQRLQTMLDRFVLGCVCSVFGRGCIELVGHVVRLHGVCSCRFLSDLRISLGCDCVASALPCVYVTHHCCCGCAFRLHQ